MLWSLGMQMEQSDVVPIQPQGQYILQWSVYMHVFKITTTLWDISFLQRVIESKGGNFFSLPHVFFNESMWGSFQKFYVGLWVTLKKNNAPISIHIYLYISNYLIKGCLTAWIIELNIEVGVRPRKLVHPGKIGRRIHFWGRNFADQRLMLIFCEHNQFF